MLINRSHLIDSLFDIANRLEPVSYRKPARAALAHCREEIETALNQGKLRLDQLDPILRTQIHLLPLSHRVRNNYVGAIRRVTDQAVDSGLIAPAPATNRMGYPILSEDLGVLEGSSRYESLVQWAIQQTIRYEDLEPGHLVAYQDHLRKVYPAPTFRRYRSELQRYWIQATSLGLLRDVPFRSARKIRSRKQIGLAYHKWPTAAKAMWQAVRKRCSQEALSVTQPWPDLWADETLKTYERQLSIYFGFLVQTEPNWTLRPLEEWLADTDRIQSCLVWLETIRPGRYHDRYYMPHVFSTLLRHHFGNSVASEVVESLKGQRRLPPPKQPGEILLEWDEIQSVREEVMAEIRSLQASADPDTKVVGRCSDLILMAILLTRPVRLRNLAAARLGTHLIRDTTGSWHFLVPQFEVKNAREIRLEIPPDLGCCLDTYFDIRARAGQPPESGPVFLNQRGTGCGPQTLRQRTRDLSKELWATRHSPQAFRSIMASAYVNEHPEDVTAVQCLLGHASPSTTFRYYILPDKATTRTRIRSWLEAHPALEKLRNLASTISGAAWCGNEPVKIVPPE